MKDELLTLEKLKIHERLQGVETKIEVLCNQVTLTTEGLKELVENHNKLLYGNGQAGLKEKVSALQASEEKRSWTLRALIIATLGLIANLIKDFMK